MNFTIKISISLIAGGLLMFFASLSAAGQTVPNYLITPSAAGDIYLGMTIAEARQVFKNARFEQYDYSEEGVWVEVAQGEKHLLRLTTDQKKRTSSVEGKIPINETARIESIELADPRYKTGSGVHVGMPVTEAERRLGKITKIELWEYDGSEHAEFSNAPQGFSYTITAKKSEREGSTAGIYAQNQYTTARYAPGAVLETIKISKVENPQTGNAEPNYLITDNSAGAIRLGMTVAEVRNIIKPMVLSFELEDYDRNSFRSMIAVRKTKDAELPLLMLGVDQETLISDPNAAAKINENAKITQIQIWDAGFKTKEGIYSGMPLEEAQKRLGKLVGICWTTINNGREYATFINQPKGISYTIQGVEQGGGEFGVMDSRDIRQGDITTKSTEQAYIDRIIVNDRPFGYQ